MMTKTLNIGLKMHRIRFRESMFQIFQGKHAPKLPSYGCTSHIHTTWCLPIPPKKILNRPLCLLCKKNTVCSIISKGKVWGKAIYATGYMVTHFSFESVTFFRALCNQWTGLDYWNDL